MILKKLYFIMLLFFVFSCKTIKKTENSNTENFGIQDKCFDIQKDSNEMILTVREYDKLKFENMERFAELNSIFDFELNALDMYYKLTPKSSLNLAGKESTKLKDIWYATKNKTREQAVASLNWLTNLNRNRKYKSSCKTSQFKYRILAEGDSWFLHPIENDIIDELEKEFAIRSIAAAGDKFENMVDSEEYLTEVRLEIPDVLLLSGGGNDLFGDDFSIYLSANSDLSIKTANKGKYLSYDFFKKVDFLLMKYEQVFLLINKNYPNIKIFCHTYDYAIPKGFGLNGKYLGHAFDKHNILSENDRKETVEYVMDYFYRRLSETTKKYKNVYVIDLRKILKDSMWADDEIHANKKGAEELAKEFKKQMLWYLNKN